MNTTARALGLKNTHFDSFDGIGNGSNYSTPRDLTKLASSAMKFSNFRAVVKTRSTKQKVTTKSGGYRYMSWTNTNTLLGSYSGTIGVKTGSGPAGQVLPGLRRHPQRQDGHRHRPGLLLGVRPHVGREAADGLRLQEVARRIRPLGPAHDFHGRERAP